LAGIYFCRTPNNEFVCDEVNLSDMESRQKGIKWPRHDFFDRRKKSNLTELSKNLKLAGENFAKSAKISSLRVICRGK